MLSGLACVELTGGVRAFPLIRDWYGSGRLTKAKKRLAWSIERARAVEHFVILGRSDAKRSEDPSIHAVTWKRH